MFPLPGVTCTEAYGISNNGVIVGRYNVDGRDHGFIYDTGKYTTFDVPGSLETIIFGVNNSGQLAGYYHATNGDRFGFLATPNVPLPSSLLLLGPALGGLVMLRRRRRP